MLELAHAVHTPAEIIESSAELDHLRWVRFHHPLHSRIGAMEHFERRLGHPAARAKAASEKRGFHSQLATYGGGHIHVPDEERGDSGILPLAPQP
jgi:hypothetical protein